MPRGRKPKIDPVLAEMLEKELIKQAQKEYKKYLKSILPEVERLFRLAIQMAVYDYYTPVKGGYDRTYDFITKISVKIRGYSIVVSHDIASFEYFSKVNGEPVSEDIPSMINFGHDDESSILNQWHHYEGRNYINKFLELIADQLELESSDDIKIRFREPFKEENW